MRPQKKILERAFQAIDELLGSSAVAPPIKAEQRIKPEPSRPPLVYSGPDNLQTDVALETACRCSKRAFPHIHSPEDRQAAIRRWNRESRHPLPLATERIQ
jgi:hypothetical protein